MTLLLHLKNTNIKFATLVISAFLIINSCTPRADNAETQTQSETYPYWVLLDASKPLNTKDSVSWNFKLSHPGDYVIQVLRDSIHENSDVIFNIKMDNQLLEIPLNKSYVINNGTKSQTVSELKQSITISDTLLHTITLKSDIAFEKIRFAPFRSTIISSGKYEDKWLTMHNSPEKQAALQWFNDAKFGMFIHWGLYSQAGGLWKNTTIEKSPYPGPRVAEWLMSTFRISRDEYKELAKTFNPDASFAQNIAKLAKEAGMKYIVITSKHHDGFALFDSASSEYDMVDATPYKKDAIKELYDACLKEGIGFGVYYSHGNDWMDGADGNVLSIKKRNDSLGIYTHMQGKNYWDPSPNSFDSYIENKALPQISELLQLLPELKLIWFDGEGNITENQSFKFYKLIYDTNPNVLVTRRVGFGFGDYEDAGDNVIPSGDEVLNKQWETCGTTNNSWGYKSYDTDWKSTTETLYYLVDIASKGGNYLLNIGPDGDGHVPTASANILREIGDWFKINGEAIYGSSRWKIINEGQEETRLEGTGHREAKGFQKTFTNKDFWFTTKNDKVYAISLAPIENEVHIKSFNTSIGTIKNIKLLGSDEKLKWNQTETELTVIIKNLTHSKNGYALEITL